MPPTPKAFRHCTNDTTDTTRSKSAFIVENNNNNMNNDNNNNNNNELYYSPTAQQSQIECLNSCQVFQVINKLNFFSNTFIINFNVIEHNR